MSFNRDSFVIKTLWTLWLKLAKSPTLLPYFESLLENEKKRALEEHAAQMAHNIRSPLGALKVAFMSGANLTPEQLKLARTATLRLEDITKNLSGKSKKASSSSSEKHPVAHLFLESLSEAKSLAYGKKINVSYFIEKTLWTSQVEISKSAFSQSLRNLVSNSLAAMNIQDSSTLLLSLRKDTAKNIVMISVTDPGRGTNVNTSLPLTENADWLVEPFQIDDSKEVVVIDDDEQIHKYWREKVGSTRVASFYSGKTVKQDTLIPDNIALYVVDYNLGPDEATGLEILEKLKEKNKCILLTNQYDDPTVQKRCRELGVKILPKQILSDFPIEVCHFEKADIVLIDDDELVHMSWRFCADQQKKRLLIAKNESEFRKLNVSRDTEIYIDKNLGSNASGIELAQKLHKEGFRNLYIASGDTIEAAESLAFLKGIRGKEFPGENS